MNACCTFAGHRWVRRAPPYTLHTSKILFIALHKASFNHHIKLTLLLQPHD